MVDINKDLDKVTRDDIMEYAVSLSKRFKPKTILERKKFLFIFFSWLHDTTKDKLKEDLLKDINIKKENQDILDKDVLIVKEIKKMIQVSKTIRDKAIISLLYETGARKGEFLRLKVKDIEFNDYGAKIRIPQGKTVSRTNFSIDSVADLKLWFESHPERDNSNAPLFVTEGAWLGRALGEDGLKRILKENARRAKIKKKVYPHLFRHSKATEFARAGKNEDFLRKWFGWSKSSKTPSLYVNTNTRDLERQYQEMKGIKEAKDEAEEENGLLKPKTCPRCGEKGIPSYFKFCPKCSQVIDVETAITREELEKQMIAQPLKAEGITDLKEAVFQSIKDTLLKDPKFLKKLSKVAR